MKRISTKRTLITSVISLMLCFAMLLGTTWAWFTDEVTSSGNKVVAGNLKIDLEILDKESGVLSSIKDSAKAIFDYDLWEPGYTAVTLFRVENEGNLALKWEARFVSPNELSSLANVIDVYVCPGATGYPADRNLDGYVKVGTVADFVNTIKSTTYGTLLSGEIATLGIALKMQESAGNEYMGESLGEFDIQIAATQYSSESDSYDETYDNDSVFPDMPVSSSSSASLDGMLNNDNTTSNDITIGKSTDLSNAYIPAGVQVADGATKLTLTIEQTERSSNITMNDGTLSRSIDVHIDGIAQNNTVPMTINLGAILPTGLKDSSVELFHVENGVANKMELVTSLTAHNQFTYNSDTGEVSIHIASFSEVTAVVAIDNPWNGGVDTSWYNDTDTEFHISTAEELAGLGELVANGNTFYGKTIVLDSDLDLGGEGHTDENGNPLVFYPIGYKYDVNDTNDTPHPFEGTFDGNNKKIKDLYQNTWNIKGHYNGTYYKKSLGLFALVSGGTVKNLTLENFILEGEFAPTGCVAGRGNGGTFENITLRRCLPCTYNTGVGGIIGWDEGDNAQYTFTDITVGSSNKIVALWGSWDVSCGGIMGYLGTTSKAVMTNCTVAATIDVYNDVCGNYQYYQYRYAGMIVGTIGRDSTPVASNLECHNCKVYFGSWSDYYYCEFEKNSSASYTEDFQFSRVDDKDIVFDLEGNAISCTHAHTPNEDKLACYLPFSQLFTGYGWGANPVFEHPGVEILTYDYDVIYLEGTSILEVEYVTDNSKAYNLMASEEGFNWIDSNGKVITSIPAGQDQTIVVYKNDVTKFYARFVDVSGQEIYSEQFIPGATSLKNVPAVPTVAGYYGQWEPYADLLKNAKSDIIIKPVYTVDENPEILSDFTDANALFNALSQGKTAIMSRDLTGKISAGNQELMANVTASGVTDKDAYLSLNSFELSYDASHSAAKAWTLFQINSGSSLTVSGGISQHGNLIFRVTNLNKNASATLFDIQNGGTLILERGVVIEIRCDSASDFSKITLIKGISNLNDKDANGLSIYPGLNIIEDTATNSLKIIVTGTTTLVGNTTN